MKYELQKRAFEFAKYHHGNQVRKYTNEPYIVHPVAVAVSTTLACLGFPAKVQAAALMHDVVEDTDATFDDVEYVFGLEIAQLVFEVSDISKPEDGNRAFRKEKDRLHYGKGSVYGQSIKLSDLIDNSKSIAKYDKDFSVTYFREKELLLGVLKQGDLRLWNHANSLVSCYKNLAEW